MYPSCGTNWVHRNPLVISVSRLYKKNVPKFVPKFKTKMVQILKKPHVQNPITIKTDEKKQPCCFGWACR